MLICIGQPLCYAFFTHQLRNKAKGIADLLARLYFINKMRNIKRETTIASISKYNSCKPKKCVSNVQCCIQNLRHLFVLSSQETCQSLLGLMKMNGFPVILLHLSPYSRLTCDIANSNSFAGIMHVPLIINLGCCTLRK